MVASPSGFGENNFDHEPAQLCFTPATVLQSLRRSAERRKIRWLLINPPRDGEHCCTSEITSSIQSELYSQPLSFVPHSNATSQSHRQLAQSVRTKCMGGSERTDDFPKVVIVRWNSPANHLVLSNPIEPMLENWPITGHVWSPGMGSV